MDITNWQPPPGYRQVESTLPGITVYGPAPEAEKKPDRETFKCPRCGAETAYNPDAGSVTCSHCGFVQAIQAAVPGEMASQAEFTPDALRDPVRGWGQDRCELHCESCGADISIESNDLTAACPFCGSNQVINRAPSQEGLRPNFLIPFKINPQACIQKSREWLGRGWMFPSDLSKSGENARFQGVYLPYWTFSSHIAASWEAQVGHERTESYYDAGSKSMKTRVVIDWRWESGQVGVPIREMLASGSRNISSVLLERINPFRLEELTEYEPSFLAGWRAKNYDIPLQAAWDSAREKMRETAKAACYDDISTSHVRSFSMSADFDNETWRLILLPVYLTAYRYQEKVFQVMVNGQTGVVAGQKPVAWPKVWLAIAGLLLPGAAISLAGLPLVALAGIGAIPLVIGMILLVIGIVLGGVILKQAFEADDL